MPSKSNSIAKVEFKVKLASFVETLAEYALTSDGQWSVKGFVDVFRNVYAISCDTKVVSKIVEIHLLPKIIQFAEDNGYAVVLADYQNWYPDLSFVSKNDPSVKFAVDIKTTYRDPKHPGYCNGFTLGSHGAYFINRSGKKNIQFPYNEYLAHICLGIIYTRCEIDNPVMTEIYEVKSLGSELSGDPTKSLAKSVKVVPDLQSITSVIKDFQFFVREKWEIASDSSGSGNTANIGSITNIDDILNGNGMFKNLGEKWFDEYWMNYGKITMKDSKGNQKKVTKLADFLQFKGKDMTLINARASRRKTE